MTAKANMSRCEPVTRNHVTSSGWRTRTSGQRCSYKPRDLDRHLVTSREVNLVESLTRYFKNINSQWTWVHSVREYSVRVYSIRVYTVRWTLYDIHCTTYIREAGLIADVRRIRCDPTFTSAREGITKRSKLVRNPTAGPIPTHTHSIPTHTPFHHTQPIPNHTPLEHPPHSNRYSLEPPPVWNHRTLSPTQTLATPINPNNHHNQPVGD